MATKSMNNGNSTPSMDPNAMPEYEAFPEPRGWALNWDGGALQDLSKPSTNPSKPKRS